MLLRQPAVSVVGLEGCVDARSGKAVHVASIFSRRDHLVKEQFGRDEDVASALTKRQRVG
eukprot:scaffold906_cov186-Alexandrium_tamarense.AAC.24